MLRLAVGRSMMSRWPKPPPEPGDVGRLRGQAPAGPPSLQTLEDGSRWLSDGGSWRQVAPPGTDQHELRWARRSMPALSRALHHGSAFETSSHPGDPHGWADAVADVEAAAEEDDVALLQAAEHVAFHALRRAVRDGHPVEDLRGEFMAASLLREAAERAKRRSWDTTGLDEFEEASLRWRTRRDGVRE